MTLVTPANILVAFIALLIIGSANSPATVFVVGFLLCIYWLVKNRHNLTRDEVEQ